jgi:hypothetical protein
MHQRVGGRVDECMAWSGDECITHCQPHQPSEMSGAVTNKSTRWPVRSAVEWAQRGYRMGDVQMGRSTTRCRNARFNHGTISGQKAVHFDHQHQKHCMLRNGVHGTVSLTHAPCKLALTFRDARCGPSKVERLHVNVVAYTDRPRRGHHHQRRHHCTEHLGDNNTGQFRKTSSESIFFL